jgi:maltose alpha-D-glucosyltransferase/alpha-amylase
VATWAQWWRDAASAAFVRGYRSVAEIEGLLPRDMREMAALLEVMVMEKAMYELRYELDNRPTWAHLPLAVLAEAAGA